MQNFYQDLPLEAAESMERLSRLMYELRDNRARLLEQYGVTDEDALLALVRQGRIAEHPGYDHYLAACVLADTRDTVREQLQALMREVGAA